MIPPLRSRLLRRYESDLLLDLAAPRELREEFVTTAIAFGDDSLSHEMLLDKLQMYRQVRTLHTPLDLFALFVQGNPKRVQVHVRESAVGMAYWTRPEKSYPFPLMYPWRRRGFRTHEEERKKHLAELAEKEGRPEVLE